MQTPSHAIALPEPLPAAEPRSARATSRGDIDPADIAACCAALRQGSRSFLAASLLLPRDVREAACALYAFCRMADDAVDEGDDEAAAVRELRRRLARAYDTSLPVAALAAPADRALAAVVARFDIPRALPEALIEGFEWDADGRSYETLEDLNDYAARVAGTVGAMMSLLMGVRSPDAVARACDLGVAMQLSNIARDVGEDAAMGRLYLPRRWMRDAGIDPDEWLAAPVFSPALGTVVERLLSAADALYQRVGAGVAQLPLSCRPGINAARFLYEAIGNKVREAGCNSVASRAVVPGSSKAVLLLKALTTLRPSLAASSVPPLEANRFLVDAVLLPTQEDALPGERTSKGRRSTTDRLIWVIELFDRLERQSEARTRVASQPVLGGGSEVLS
ncbi:MAG: phytoene/squalene synthase family protein [Variovorax sp.]|nr:MAG: phytoene/squalene synthase family protein [Variovorax sp.]